MDRSAVKQWGVITAVAAVSVAGTWLYSADAHSVRLAEVTTNGCGTAAGFGLPLTLLGESAASLPVAIGPIPIDGLAAPLSLSFDPALSPVDRELTLRDGMLALPMAFGRTPAVPERVTLHCRDGAIVSVRYTGGRSAAASFNVSVAGADEARPDPVPEEDIGQN